MVIFPHCFPNYEKFYHMLTERFFLTIASSIGYERANHVTGSRPVTSFSQGGGLVLQENIMCYMVCIMAILKQRILHLHSVYDMDTL